MYELLKKLAPRRFLLANETWLRWVFAIMYRGSQHRCNVCGIRLSRFVRTKNGLSCPRCGSIMRNRRLFAILAPYLEPSANVLDFSPSRALYRAMKRFTSVRYVASDFVNEFVADEHFDLTNLDVRSASVDLILCYHVLEHISEDKAAISEMHRVLRPGGHALIQTPFKEGEIYEDATITSAQGRMQNFGQADHVRIYSVDGLKQRLEAVGLMVTIQSFKEEPNNYYGFSPTEIVLVAQKPLGG